jgi:thiamine biosynthesis lipoprotein
MSFHDKDSDVSRLNRDAFRRPTVVHGWTFAVLELAVELNRRSNGTFDIALASALQRLGLLPRITGTFPAASGAGSRDAIELLDKNAVRFRRADVAIDLGGIAKGFAVDRALEALRRFDIPYGIVNAGGDLAAFGPNPWTIDIRDPRNPGRIICCVEVANQALASSARRFDPFHTVDTTSSAVIDPVTQLPAHAVDGVSVCAPSCMIADALTKLVMICGTDAGELLEHYDAAALLVAPDGNLQITSTWHHAVHLAA